MTPYEILGVPVNATPEQIKAAHKRLAQYWHPDKCSDPQVKPSWEARFRQIQEAYEVLSDAARREKFDATGDDAVSRDEKEAADILRDAVQRGAAEWLDSVRHGMAPVTRPLLPIVTGILINARAEQRNVKRDAEGQLAYIEALRKRQRSKGNRNVVAEMTQFFLDNVTRDLARMEHKLKLLELAMTMLAECSEEDIQADAAKVLERPKKLLGQWRTADL